MGTHPVRELTVSKPDWADELVEKKKTRGNTTITAEQLREQVAAQMQSNIERWQKDDWDAAKLDRQRKKETKRLIQFHKDDDVREELKAKYEKKGIDIGVCHSTAGKIASVKLPFTNAEWGDLL